MYQCYNPYPVWILPKSLTLILAKLSFFPMTLRFIMFAHSFKSPYLSSGPKMKRIEGKKTTEDRNEATIVVMKRVPN